MSIKNLRKMLAVVLAFVMGFTMVSSVQAAELVLEINPFNGMSHMVSDCGTSAETTFIVDGGRLTFMTHEREYGVVFYEYFNGVLLRSAVIYNNQRSKMYITDYSDTGRMGQSEVMIIDFTEFTDITAEEIQASFDAQNFACASGDIDTLSSSPTFPFPGFTFLGRVNYTYLHTSLPNPTSSIAVFNGGPVNTVSPDTINFFNTVATFLSVAGLVVAVLGATVASSNPLTAVIFLKLGIAISAGQEHLIPRGSFGLTTVRWTFGTMPISRMGVPASGGARQFTTLSQMVTSTTHHGTPQRIWPEFGNISVWDLWGNTSFGIRIYQATFGSWPGVLGISGWQR